MFAMCNGESRPGPLEVWIKALPEAQEGLVASDPKRFLAPPTWVTTGVDRRAPPSQDRLVRGDGSRAGGVPDDGSKEARDPLDPD